VKLREVIDVDGTRLSLDQSSQISTPESACGHRRRTSHNERTSHMRIFRTSAALVVVGMVGLVFSAASPAGASTAATALPGALAAPGANA
jgi:hypothetical protein